MQEEYVLERLYTEPQVVSAGWAVGSIRLEFLRWPRGEMAATGDSVSPIYCNRIYVLDGNDYREQPTQTIRSRFSFLRGHECQGLALAAKEDLTKIRVTLNSETLAELGGEGGNMLEFGVFQIRKDSPESGGSFHPPNTWILRPFNYNSSSFGALDANGRIQLPPGRYAVQGWTTGMENGRMRSRFRSLDNAILCPSASTYSLHYSWHIPIQGVFTITETTTFVVEMRCDRDRDKSWGFGYTSQVSPDVYASLMLFRQQT